MHDARPLLLCLDNSDDGVGPSSDERVRVVAATTPAGAWELPVVGLVDAPAAVLIRPDGHVAWAGATGDPALGEAITVWFGAPTS